MRPFAAILSAILFVAGACGDDGSAAVATTTSLSRETTTTAALTPEQAFNASIDAQLSSPEPDFADNTLDLAKSLCATLTDLPAGIDEDDAMNDTPETDEAIGGVVQTMAIASTYEGIDNPEVAAVILGATAEHICPEHAADIEALLAARGH